MNCRVALDWRQPSGCLAIDNTGTAACLASDHHDSRSGITALSVRQLDYLSLLRRPMGWSHFNEQVLQQQLGEWMEEFDAREARKRAAADADADESWTVVKRHKVQLCKQAQSMQMLCCCNHCSPTATCAANTALSI